MAWDIGRASRSIWVRLLVVNLFVVAVPLAGVGFARLYERQLLAALERDLVHQAQAIAHAAPVAPDVLRAMAADTRARLRVVDGHGRVIADSGGAAGEDVSDLVEIRRALAGRYGAATRTTYDRGRTDLYVAVPIRGARGEVVGAAYVVRSTAPVGAQLHRLRRWLLRIGLGSLALAAVVSLFLAATIARPLTRLTRLAERIATGERAGSLALTRRDEIGQLARAFDRMTRELDRRAAELREMAADLSHEVRSPLTGIRGAAELLRDGAADDPASRDRFLAMILDDAARLDRTVTRLLELSRAESDASAPEPVDLAALAREVASGHAVPIAVRAPDRAVVTGRAAGLTAAVENLVVNAVQHAAPGTPVTITIAPRARRTRLSVHNLGSPLTPALRARVWDRFFTTRATAGGTGLGLAIVRSVAAMHGGASGCDSSAADGTTFWLEL